MVGIKFHTSEDLHGFNLMKEGIILTLFSKQRVQGVSRGVFILNDNPDTADLVFS